MSLDAPEALLNKVQFDIRLCFCRRSQDNMHGMKISTFEVLNDPKTGLTNGMVCVDLGKFSPLTQLMNFANVFFLLIESCNTILYRHY
jgi:hypothetical protein